MKRLNMRKNADKIEKININYILKAFEELDFEITDPEDVGVFIEGLVYESGPSPHLLNKLILNNMEKFTRSFIENWKIYFVENYGLKGSFSKEEATNILLLLLMDSYHGEKNIEGEETEEELREKIKENEKRQHEIIHKMHELEKEPISTETVPDVLYPEYSSLLNKYTPDEIWGIARGKKTDVSPEEIEQAKEVISRGIIANTLNLRKIAQSTPETIQKAQQGDKDTIAKVIGENESLIANVLIKWGYAPGTPEFEDVLSDVKVKMIEDVIPKYDLSKGAFSTYLTAAVYNFLKNIPRGREHKIKEKEVSLEEPVREDMTMEDVLEDPKSFLSELTLKGIRESFQEWLRMKFPELENVMLRIYDLRVGEHSYEEIAEILNEEKMEKNPVTRRTVAKYVDLYLKPFLEKYFESFKTASLGMKKISRWERWECKALFENIEFTDRYDALGIPLPDPQTMCSGQCEGIGCISINKDDPDERFIKLWEEAETESPSEDGWHFVVCPDCNGTGKRKV